MISDLISDDKYFRKSDIEKMVNSDFTRLNDNGALAEESITAMLKKGKIRFLIQNEETLYCGINAKVERTETDTINDIINNFTI